MGSQGGRGSETERRPGWPRAPLVPVVGAVAVGIVGDRYLLGWESGVWAILTLGATVGAWMGRRWGWVSGSALVVAFVALGAGWHHQRWSDLKPDDLAWDVSEEPRLVWLRGVLVEVPTAYRGEGLAGEGTTRTTLEVTGLCDGRSWREASGTVRVTVRGEWSAAAMGEPVQAAGNLTAIPGPLNPGEFDRRDYLRAEGIRLGLSVADPESLWPDLEGLSWPVFLWLGRARTWSRERLIQGLDADVAPLAAALLLGRREGIDLDIRDAFARTGTMHLLAISGLHVQALAALIWWVCRLLGLGRRPSFVTVALLAVLYAVLVGGMPSVVRSVAMTVTVCVAGALNRQARFVNLLALAALVTLMINPANLFDAGWQLSFLAIAALAWGVKPIADRLRFAYYAVTFRAQGPEGALDRLERTLGPWWRREFWKRWGLLRQGIVASAVVWLVTLPLVAERFHLASPIGVVLNLPLIPMTSLALLAAGATLILAAVWSPLAGPAAWVCGLLLKGVRGLVQWGMALRGGYTFTAGPPMAWVLGFYGLLGLATLATAGRWRGRWWTWGLLGVWAAAGLGLGLRGGRPEGLEAEVLAVGHGLAVIVQAPDGRVLLYDCGRLSDPSVGRRIIAPALWERRVGRVETVILSHADADHYDGLPDLLNRFPIGEVRVPPGFAGPANPGAARLVEEVRARGIPVRPIAAGDHWVLGGTATASVLHPPREGMRDAPDNAWSVVLDIAESGRHLLLTGDLEGIGLAELLGRPAPEPPPAAWLAPHHGGRSANPPALYRWADPALVVVSQRRPAAGSRDPLAELEKRGVPVLRTWQRGAIRLRWTDEGLIASGFLDGPTRLPSIAPGLAAVVPGWSRGLIGVLGGLVGLAGFGILVVIEWGAWGLVQPGRRLVPEDVRPGPSWESVEMRAPDGTLLRGLWHPAAEATGRTVVLLHGFAEDRARAAGLMGMTGRAEALLRHGWNVLLPDARGCGRSEGEVCTFGGREGEDLRGWLDLLATRIGPGFTPVAWGRSMGSALALRAATMAPRLRALVLESPYADLRAVVSTVLARRLLPRWLAGPLLFRAARLAGVSLSRPRPLDLAPLVRLPTLLIHGSSDPIASPAEVLRLAAAFPFPPERIEVPGAGHADVLDVAGPPVLDRVAAFLAEALAIPSDSDPTSLRNRAGGEGFETVSRS